VEKMKMRRSINCLIKLIIKGFKKAYYYIGINCSWCCGNALMESQSMGVDSRAIV